MGKTAERGLYGALRAFWRGKNEMSNTFTVDFEKVCPMCAEDCVYFEIEEQNPYFTFDRKITRYECRNRNLCKDVYLATVKEMKINEGSKAN